jgi:hypothetical protein
LIVPLILHRQNDVQRHEQKHKQDRQEMDQKEQQEANWYQAFTGPGSGAVFINPFDLRTMI